VFCPQLVHPLMECRVDQGHSNNWKSDKSRHGVVLVVVNKLLADMSRSWWCCCSCCLGWRGATVQQCANYNSSWRLVKLLQQEIVDGSLVVPLATLDSKLQPNKDANDVLQYVLLGVKLLNL
jgi:hypothetical protein